MAEGAAVIQRLEGENQEHHEWSLHSRSALGMGFEQSHSSRAAECEAFSCPTILSPEQIRELLDKMGDLPKTAVLLGASTGLRVGELLGLKMGGR